MGAITQRIMSGESTDPVTGSSQSISGLASAGRIRPGNEPTICKTGIRVVVPSGAPQAKITVVEDFKRALLAAKVIVYADPPVAGPRGFTLGPCCFRVSNRTFGLNGVRQLDPRRRQCVPDPLGMRCGTVERSSTGRPFGEDNREAPMAREHPVSAIQNEDAAAFSRPAQA